MTTLADCQKLLALSEKSTPNWQQGTAGAIGLVSFDGDDIVLVATGMRQNNIDMAIAARNDARARQCPNMAALAFSHLGLETIIALLERLINPMMVATNYAAFMCILGDLR